MNMMHANIAHTYLMHISKLKNIKAEITWITKRQKYSVRMYKLINGAAFVYPEDVKTSQLFDHGGGVSLEFLYRFNDRANTEFYKLNEQLLFGG